MEFIAYAVTSDGAVYFKIVKTTQNFYISPLLLAHGNLANPLLSYKVRKTSVLFTIM